MFGLLWLGGILVAAVLGNLLFDAHLIADFVNWKPFVSRWLGWITGIQLGVVLLAVTLFIYFLAMRDEYFARINPWMDFAVICVFYSVFYPVVVLLLWLADLALIRFF